MSKELAATGGEDRNVANIVAHVAKIQDAMKRVMVRDVHYGIVPGCKSPSLWQPGADVLGMMFQLVPDYTVTTERDGEHREVTVECRITHKPTGAIAGSGIGLCSTREKKYAFRKDGSANPNIADTYNTVLKIAKKRAYIDAIIRATGASDVFTQDIGDPEDQDGGGNAAPPPQNMMPKPKVVDAEATVSTPRPPTPERIPTSGEFFGVVSVETRTAQKTGKQFFAVTFEAPDASTFEATTFSTTVEALARSLIGKLANVDIETKKSGDAVYRNIVALAAHV